MDPLITASGPGRVHAKSGAASLLEPSPSGFHHRAEADLTAEGSFGETVIEITEQGLSVGMALASTEAPGPGLAEDAAPAFWPWSRLEALKAENTGAGGMLLATIDSREVLLARYTLRQTRHFDQLAKKASKRIESLKASPGGDPAGAATGPDRAGPDGAGERQEGADSVKEKEEEIRCPTCGRLYPDPPRKVCPKCLKKGALFLRVLGFAPRYKKDIFLILFFMLLSSLLGLLNPYIGGKVLFDDALVPGGKHYGRVLEVVLVFMGVRLLSLLCGIASARVKDSLSARVVFELKVETFQALQRLSLSFFSQRQTGNLMTGVNDDAGRLQHFFHDGLPYFISNLINLVGVLGILFWMDWRLTLLVLLPLPFLSHYIRVHFRRFWGRISRVSRRSSAVWSLLSDNLGGVRVVKAFGKEREETSRFEKRNDRLSEADRELGRMGATLFPFMGFIMGSGGILAWGVGGYWVAKGEMTLGVLLSFIGYLAFVYGPLEFMTNVIDWFSSCMNAAHRIFTIKDAVPEVAEHPEAVRLPRIRGEVRLEGVSFGYEPGKPVLRDVDLEAKAGEVIGIVGHSGAGKSTLINLVTRLYDPLEGRILLDGVDLRRVATRDLRAQVGMVLQETFLFTGTIAENIAYAKPEAARAEIIHAAKVANAHDFILKLPDGYDTPLGKRGINLSGGERQRLSIARAILHDPRILILDEATASVDTETERLIQGALESLVRGRTTFIIAHRLSTLRGADRLFVLDKGKVVESGTPEDLLKAKGKYHEMMERQKEALRIRIE